MVDTLLVVDDNDPGNGVQIYLFFFFLSLVNFSPGGNFFLLAIQLIAWKSESTLVYSIAVIYYTRSQHFQRYFSRVQTSLEMEPKPEVKIIIKLILAHIMRSCNIRD